MADEAARLAYLDELIATTFRLGSVTLEAYVCENCSEKNIFGHLGVETLKCQKCGHSQASIVPRPPSPGEVTTTHVLAALQILDHQQSRHQKTELPPMTDTEIGEQSPGTRLFLARHRATVIRETVVTVKKIAEELAELDAVRQE